ncbi:MAG: DUF1579 family protein [Candidatus Krumholzibacteriia bacterium]
MSVPDPLGDLIGDWAGVSRLWMSPDHEAQESATEADVDIAADGRFFVLRYAWTQDDREQDGMLLLGFQKDGTGEAVWVDSWHMDDRMMHCKGEIRPDGTAAVTGSYAAPPGPDWGWRLEIQPDGSEGFTLMMFNIDPEGQESRAVEAIYARVD